MKFWRFSAALPLLAVSLWAAAPAVKDLVLPETVCPQLDAILKRAVAQSPQMLNRTLDLEIAENNRIQARANLLPGVGGYANYYQSEDTRADQTGRLHVTKIGYNFSLTQPVYYWGERTNNARIGEIQQKIAQGSYRDGYRLLAQDIRERYLQLTVRKAALERSRLNNKYNQDIRKLSEERYAKKVMSEAEIFPVRLNADRAQIELERADSDYAAARQSLGRLVGADDIDGSTIPDEIPELTYTAGTFDELLAGFLTQKDPQTAEAAKLRNQLEIDNLTYLNQKTRLRPKVSFVAGVSQDEQSYTINVALRYRVNSIFTGFSANWAIFDGYASQAAQRNALITRRQDENNYHDLTTQLAITAQAEVKALNFSARSMSIYDRVLVSAAGSFRTRQGEYARGVVSENDVTLAHLSYYDAFLNAQNARIDYLIKVGDFLGTLAEDPVLANVAAAK